MQTTTPTEIPTPFSLMAEGLKTQGHAVSSFMMTDEVERLKAALRRWQCIRVLFVRALMGALIIWIWLVTAEAARHFIPAGWWDKFVKAPVELGISKLK